MTSGALTYEFRVKGHLDDHWSAWLGDLTITRHRDGTSTLTGPVANQAQLHGVLARLRDIGVTLLSLNALEASPLPASLDPLAESQEGIMGPMSCQGGDVDIRSAQTRAWQNKVAKGFNTTDIPLEFCLLQGEMAEELADVAIYLLGL